MKKWLITTLFLGIFVLSSSLAFAANWQTIDGAPGVFVDAESLRYARGENDQALSEKIVALLVRRPISEEARLAQVNKESNPQMKAVFSNAAYDERLYWFNLTNGTVSLGAIALVDKNDKVLATNIINSQYIPIPQEGVTPFFYSYVKEADQSGKIAK